MKKTISILMLGAFPVLAMASGDHNGGHDMSGHNMSGGQAMEHQQGSHDMGAMSHESHEAAAGRPGDPASVSRTILVTMDDTMRFAPDQLKFRAGETVRFVVSNNGRIRHEMVIGSVDELKEHAEMMRSNPTMQHAEPNMISLAPGEQGDVVWQFDRAGLFDFACLVPGHLEAGMTGKIEIN
jgi:uncharacterized cupredoxin-like copper-binding protein